MPRAAPAASPLPGAENPLIGPLFVLLGGIAIGYAPIGLRLAADAGLGPQATALWRYVFAAPLLAVLVIASGRGFGRPNRAIVIAGVCFALDIALWHEALMRTSVANATFFVNLGNIASGVGAWLLFKERLTLRWVGAALLALPGAALLSFGAAKGGSAHWTGDLLALAAAVLVAGYLLGSRRAREGLTGLQAVFWVTCVEIVAAIGLVSVMGEAFLPAQTSALFWAATLGVGTQVIGQGLILIGVGKTPVAVSGLVVLVQPVAAALLAWALFQEAMTLWQIAGAALIIASLSAAALSAGRARP